MSGKKYILYMHIISQDISEYNYDKYYIGITCRKNPKERWGKNGEGYKQQIFYNAIQKYGWDNIEHKIVYDNLNKEEAIKLEQEMIQKYNSTLGNKGYNVTAGGEGLNKVKSKKAKLVYCIDLKKAFRSAKVASEFTGDNEYTINNKCREFDLNREVRVGYRWCYENKIYKCFDEVSRYNAKSVIYLKDNSIYASVFHANKVIGYNFNRHSVLTVDTYKKKLKNNTLLKKDRLMYLNDYLKIFDYT